LGLEEDVVVGSDGDFAIRVGAIWMPFGIDMG